MLLLPLLSQEFTYRSRTKHSLLHISSHLNLSRSLFSFTLSAWSFMFLSTFLPVNSTDLWCYWPSSNPDSAGWCGYCKQTHSSLIDWYFFRFWRGKDFKVCFWFFFWPSGKSGTWEEPVNQQHHLHVSPTCPSPIWLGHRGQLCVATWSWLVEF